MAISIMGGDGGGSVYAKSSPNYFRLSALASTNSTSGVGAAASALNGGWNPRAPTSGVGYGIVQFNNIFHNRGSGANLGLPYQWNKPFVTQFRMHPRTLGTDSNTVNRVCFGKGAGNVGGDLTLRGVGIRQVANGPIELIVHNGTTLTAVVSSFTPTITTTSDYKIVSDGSGNVTLFVDDAQVATTSAGPSTAGSTVNNNVSFESENLATITGTSNGMYVAEISFEFAI